MIDSAFGLRPVARHLCTIDECVIPAGDATATFIGDAVKLEGGENTTHNAATVIQAAAGDVIFGVIVGFIPDYSNLYLKHRLASTERRCLVALAFPQTEFEIQADAAMTAGNSGQYVDLVVGAGNAVTGRSAMEANIASLSATSGQLQIMRPTRIQDETFDTAAAGSNLVVTINESVQKVYGTTALSGAV